MKHILILLLFQLTLAAFSQTSENLTNQPDVIADSVSFVTKLNIANATKDGIYLNGYVVNIDYRKAKKLNGKTIYISGKVTIIKGLRYLDKIYDKDSNEIIPQGRLNDTKYIISPKIKIIEHKK